MFEAQQPGRLLSRRAHAGHVRRRSRAPHRPPRASGVRHRLRPVRGAGVRAGRARLPREAGRAGAPGGDGGAARRSGCERRSRRSNTEALLQQLAAQLQRGAAPAPLRWIRASVGQTLRLIPVDDIDFLRSDEKYTLVAWRDDAGQPREALIRTPLKELVTQLDAAQFAQVHRSVVVNLRAISHVTRGDNETADIHLKGRAEVLPVSRSYLHLFRQM